MDVANLTGGVYNSQDMLEGNKLACFAFQATLAGLPDAGNKVLAGVGEFFSLAESIWKPLMEDLSCAELSQYNEGLFSSYPGYNLKLPTQPAQNF